MARAEVVIDEKHCTGCGYCQILCPEGCIVITGDKLNPVGYPLPTLIDPGKCKACGICAYMCPAFAIEVYRTATGKKRRS